MASAEYVVVPRTERAQASPVTLLVLGVALFLGYAFDFLFYGRSLGISVPVFAVLFAASMFAIARVHGALIEWRNLWLLVPLFFFASMMMLRANTQLAWFNGIALLITAALVVYFLVKGAVWDLGLLGYPAVLGIVTKEMIARPAPELVAARRALPSGNGARSLAPLLRGLVLALPILILFGALLASADSIFAEFLSDAFNLNGFENFGEFIWRVVIVLAVAWLLSGALLYAVTHNSRVGASQEVRVPGRLRVTPLIGAVEGMTVLSLVSLLFAIFAWIQIANVFLGSQATADFEAYREYVRRGFGELLVVCVLTIGLLVGLRRFGNFSTNRHLLLFRLLCTLIVIFAGVMLASAWVRMDVWESVQFYINTPLRIYVRAFIAWLTLLFAWLVANLWVRQARFALGAFLATLGFLVTINLWNPDADVAAHNLSRQDELSTRYLHLLSDDAVPVLVRGLELSTDPVVKDRLKEHLRSRLETMETQGQWQSWPSYHFARAEAYSLLTKLRVSGEIR